MHRAPGRDHGGWWRAFRDLLVLAAALGVFTTIFILGDLVLYGRVNW